MKDKAIKQLLKDVANYVRRLDNNSHDEAEVQLNLAAVIELMDPAMIQDREARHSTER